jgi:threonine/homoserine/homoserine lactone efflux protein
MTAMLTTFVVVAALLTMVPGPDMLMVIRSGLRGRRAAMATALGVSAAALVWGGAAAFGLAALLERSAAAFEVVRWAGAAYLVVMGVRSLLRARYRSRPRNIASSSPAPATSAAFRAGLITDLLNPKTALFYVAILPQLVPRGYPLLSGALLFALVDALVVALLFGVLAWLASHTIVLFHHPRLHRATEGVTGVTLVGLGIRTALERL